MGEVIETIAQYLGTFPELVSFLSPILGGENGVIFVAFLAATGAFSIYIVFLFAFLGMLFIDSFWFFMSKTRLYNKIISYKRIHPHYEKIRKRLEKITHKQDMLILGLSKVLIGTRILVILLIGARRFSYGRFLTVILLPNLLWTGVLVSVGAAAKGSYEVTLNTFNNFMFAISIAVIFIIVFYVILRLIDKWLLKK